MHFACRPRGQPSAEIVRRHGILIVFFWLLVAFMFAAKPTFGTYQNIINVLQQNSVIGIIACGMTFAIILGGFDLSVGAVTALSSVVGATLMIDAGTLGIPIGIAGALFACLLVGVINGWLIAYLGVNPFVATLGTMTVVRGLIYVAHQCLAAVWRAVLLHQPRPGLHRWASRSRRSSSRSSPLLLGFVLHRTRFGHYVYAVGGNVVAASEMGVNARACALRSTFLFPRAPPFPASS